MADKDGLSPNLQRLVDDIGCYSGDRLPIKVWIELRKRLVSALATMDVPICAGHAEGWFCGRNHLKDGMDAKCIVCAFEQTPIPSSFAPSDPTAEMINAGVKQYAYWQGNPFHSDIVRQIYCSMYKGYVSPLDANRARFEERAFAQRFIMSVKKVEIGQFPYHIKDCPMKEDFISRDEKGFYLDPTLNAMWWAWQESRK